MSRNKELFTVADVARVLGVTAGRVRQILLEHPVGEIYGNTRLLTADDVQALKDVPRKMGRPRKKVS